jgi:hypothetical protein
MLELPEDYDEEAAATVLQEWFAALNIGSFIDQGLDAREQWRRCSHSDPERRSYWTGRYELLVKERAVAAHESRKSKAGKA